MRKIITITCLILSSLLILDSLDAGHALMMFLLAGVVPGTSITLSPTVMLEFFALVLGFSLSRIVHNAIRSAFRPSAQRV